MIRNLKVLGLAIVAVFAIGAVAASVASATDFFTTTKPTAWLTGTSDNNVIEVGGNLKLRCTTSKLTATVINGDDEVTALPSYAGTIPTEGATEHERETASTADHCTAIGIDLSIDMNHCHYALTGNTTGEDGASDATVWIQCPGTNRIQVTTGLGHIISVPSQTPTEGGVTYTNLASHAGDSAVRVTKTLTGITFTCAPAFGCGLQNIPVHGNSSRFTGTVDLTGYEDLGGTLTAPTEGDRVSIEWS